MSYAQANYPDTPLGDGSCGLSIKDAGCFVTTDADILTWMGHPIDPPALNAEYLDKKLFIAGCNISRDTLATARPDQVSIDLYQQYASGPANLDWLDTRDEPVFVACQLNYPNGNVDDPTHFVPLYSYDPTKDSPAQIMIVDSYDGQIKPLANYGDPATIVTAIIRYRKLSAADPIAVTPVPIPVTAPPPAVPIAPPSPPAPAPVTHPPTPEPTPTPGPVTPDPVQQPDVSNASGQVIPEPNWLIERGVTTSEWTLVIRYLLQLAVVGGGSVAAKYGLHIPDAVLYTVLGLEASAAVPVAGYAVSRGVRKAQLARGM